MPANVLAALDAYATIIGEVQGEIKGDVTIAGREDSILVKAFGHNGFIKSLEEFVHFYNTRDVEPWPAPEIPLNINTSELGNLGLTSQEEADLVAFMKTLTDGYQPNQ